MACNENALIEKTFVLMADQHKYFFWKAIPLHSTNVSGDFTPQKFVVALQHLKAGKPAKKEGFVDLAAVFYILWHRGLTCKLLKTSIEQTHDSYDYGTCPEQKHPCYQEQ